MALKNFQFDSIMRDYNRRQMAHKHLLDEHIQHAYQILPQLQELDAEEADASVEYAARMISGDTKAPKQLEQLLSSIDEQRRQLLASAGLPSDYLTLTYDCPLCKDTGFDEQGRKCSCFFKAAADLLYRESNLQEQYAAENFDTFSLDYYNKEEPEPKSGLTPYQLAQKALLTAKEYADEFSRSPGNLLIYGPTGVGKTFLSNCIAKELIESIHSVVHLSAIDFFEQLAAHQFRQEEEELVYDSISQCDLLIIDDLGTEIGNSFVVSSLCQVIDQRLKNKQGTIITTNLELSDLKDRYLDRTFSRMISGYTFLRLAGSDIRFLKVRHSQQQ